MLHIPEDITDFLHWLKAQTETFWRQNQRVELATGCYQEWPAGICWVGLADSNIDSIEATYGIRFTPDHREFLRILHTPNQPFISVEIDQESGQEHWSQENLFYNWLTDETAIRERLARPYHDLRHEWLPAWGSQPAAAERAEAFARQFDRAPALLPLTGHRYLVSEPQQPGNPVLSVWGTAIIVYGWNLRSYLLRELRDYLVAELAYPVFENGELVDWEDKPEVAAIFQADQDASLSRRISFYEEYIQPWNGWPPQNNYDGPTSLT